MQALYHLTSQEEGWIQYNKVFWGETDHIHITFILVYGDNCSILLLVIVLLFLVYKLNFIKGMFV